MFWQLRCCGTRGSCGPHAGLTCTYSICSSACVFLKCALCWKAKSNVLKWTHTVENDARLRRWTYVWIMWLWQLRSCGHHRQMVFHFSTSEMYIKNKTLITFKTSQIQQPYPVQFDSAQGRLIDECLRFEMITDDLHGNNTCLICMLWLPQSWDIEVWVTDFDYGLF